MMSRRDFPSLQSNVTKETLMKKIICVCLALFVLTSIISLVKHSSNKSIENDYAERYSETYYTKYNRENSYTQSYYSTYYPNTNAVKTCCPNCGGTGKRVCSSCNGTGKYYTTGYAPNYGFGGDTSYQISHNCITCSGSGKSMCTGCFGQGYLS